MPEATAVNTTIFAASFAVYTLGIVAIGLYSARYARRSDEDYFLAGRSLGGWVAALSASASSESGWVTLGLVGWAFASGASAYWIIPGCVLGFLFNWFVLAARLRDRSVELGAVTIPDFFAFSFQERRPILRLLSVIVIIVAMLLYVSAQLAAAGKAFSASLGGIDYRVGVLLGVAIVLVYTVIGGFRAVCWTDFLQALLMVGTLVVFPIYLLATQGGWGFITEHLREVDPELLRFTPDKSGPALIGFLLGAGALGINFGYPGQPHVLIRFMALKTRREAVVGGIVSAIWAVCVYWGAVTVGLMARAMTAAGAQWGDKMLAEETKDIYQELGLVLSAMHLLPEVMGGLVLAAVLAAICSTADSQLVVAASAAASDLYARIFSDPKRDRIPTRDEIPRRDRKGADNQSTERSHMIVNRCVVFGLGVGAALLVMFDPIQVYKYVLEYGWAILGASFGPQMILLLLWRGASYAGCCAGMGTGFMIAIVWNWKEVYDPAATGVEVYNLPLAFLAALVVNVVVSLLVPGGSRRVEGSKVEG
ncbi:MAG: sodium/proline symporter [Planctomycetota bacterium]